MPVGQLSTQTRVWACRIYLRSPVSAFHFNGIPVLVAFKYHCS